MPPLAFFGFKKGFAAITADVSLIPYPCKSGNSYLSSPSETGSERAAPPLIISLRRSRPRRFFAIFPKSLEGRALVRKFFALACSILWSSFSSTKGVLSHTEGLATLRSESISLGFMLLEKNTACPQ